MSTKAKKLLNEVKEGIVEVHPVLKTVTPHDAEGLQATLA